MIELSQEQYDAIVVHAREDYPNECCGLIGGKEGCARQVYRMDNTEHSPLNYRMDPKQQLKVFDEMDRAELDLIGIYHSHTHSAAYPSPTDIRLAYYPESLYLIVSLADQANPDLRAFHIVEGIVTAEEVVVR